MFKLNLAIIFIAFVVAQEAAFAGRAIDRMIYNGGAFLRLECFSRNGKTTIGANVIPNQKELPINFFTFHVEVDNKPTKLERIFLPPTLNAYATTELNYSSRVAVFQSGEAYSLSINAIPKIHRFEQRSVIAVTCD